MQVCVNIHCAMNGAEELVERLVVDYGIAPGVTVDSGVELELTYCFGSCDTGPNLDIDGEFHVGVTADRLDDLMARLAIRREEETE
jgi:NADH:ubiquinone oxidoreductase subunit E